MKILKFACGIIGVRDQGVAMNSTLTSKQYFYFTRGLIKGHINSIHKKNIFLNAGRRVSPKFPKQNSLTFPSFPDKFISISRFFRIQKMFIFKYYF